MNTVATAKPESPTPSIRFLGHSAISIISPRGVSILVDPWLEGNPSCPAEFVNPEKVDIICLTHGHSDHASDAVRLARAHGATIYAPFELGQLLIKDGVPASQVQPMNKGGSVAVPESAGLRITLTQAFHSSSYQMREGETMYAGEACGVVITLESQHSIYHAGDTLLFSDMKLIKDRFNPRIAFLPIGDRFTMGPEDAAQAVRWLEPEIVVPLHHSTFPLLSGTPESFAGFVKELGVRTRCVALKPGESMSL